MIKIPPTANIQVPAPPVLGKLNPLLFSIVAVATEPSAISSNTSNSFPPNVYVALPSTLPSSSASVITNLSPSSGRIYPLGAFVSFNVYVPSSIPNKYAIPSSLVTAVKPVITI